MSHHLLFRFFYVTFYVILTIVLLGLILITPADTIVQANNNGQNYNSYVIGIGYGLTGFVAILFLLVRWWSDRRDLAGIPKTWIPIEKGEVSKKVRKMIVASLTRSAAIAWDSRPRVSSEPPTIVSEPDARDTVVRPPEAKPDDQDKRGFFRKRFTRPEKEEPIVAIPPPSPVWGDIAHDGWASPTSPDLPNLHYTTVILELPHLIEARAVSLAPPDPESTNEPPLPDIRAVDLLQRPASMGLRDYIGHLMSIEVLTSPAIAADFLSAYEYARFGARPLDEEQFRDLMKQFSELLRTMAALSPAIMSSLDLDEESDIDDDANSSSTPATPRSRSLASTHTASSRSGSEGTIRTAPSRRVGTVASARRSEFSTAPATPRSKKRVVSRAPSMNSFAQSRRPYLPGSGSSSDSLRSLSQGSVIRLSRTNEDGELPYTLHIPVAR
ncbi:hypothetical protein LSUE1_G007669 [Lachnellula suecica]|uniref:Defect at low temperature protein 1 n=1 Tax=Lachnellula suecica TaxID=602035 RepID=A0A8T9C3S9_9HELO|nr:hypothetical protein LSUE1_G007669 [Lachnellula suecica]